MTKRIPEVGDVYKCLDGISRIVKTGELVRITSVDVEEEDADYVTINSSREGVWSYGGWARDFEFVSSSAIKFEGKHYINVKAYAEKYGITLDKAQQEIQPKLFEMGYAWPIGQNIYNHNDCLVLNYFTKNEITHASVDFMGNNPMTEIIIERKEEVKISFSVKEAPIEYVEFNGKQYEKAKLEQALKLIEGDE